VGVFVDRKRTHQSSSAPDSENPRIRRALGKTELLSDDTPQPPPLPTVIDEQSTLDWIREVTPLMDPRARYTRDLIAIAQQRHDYRKAKH
jgi:hypothetical protein